MDTNVRNAARAIASVAGHRPFDGNGTHDDVMEKMSVSPEARMIAEMTREFISGVSDKMYYMSVETRRAVLAEMSELGDSDGFGAFTMFMASMAFRAEMSNSDRMNGR